MEHNTIQSVLFDLDGTLLDSTGMWHTIDCQILQHFNRPVPENISETIRKMSIEESSAYFVKEFQLPCTEQELADFVEELATLAYREQLQLKPGVIELLDYLDSIGVNYGVATATYPALAKAALERLHIYDRLEFLLTEAELGITKTQPQLFYKAASQFHAGKRQMAVVEDSLHCIETAKAAGFFTVGVADPVSACDWQQIKATATVSYKNIANMKEIFMA